MARVSALFLCLDDDCHWVIVQTLPFTANSDIRRHHLPFFRFSPCLVHPPLVYFSVGGLADSDEPDEDGEKLQQGGIGAAGGVEKGKAAGGADKGKAKSPKV